jgi:hypothetical protein
MYNFLDIKQIGLLASNDNVLFVVDLEDQNPIFASRPNVYVISRARADDLEIHYLAPHAAETSPTSENEP